MDFIRKHFDAAALGAKHPGGVYVYHGRIELAINAALARKRPLLISGPPGSGKSTLAGDVARLLEWRYLKRVVSSGTRADDLLWGYDSLRRLNDATTKRGLLPDPAYLDPGVLWWAFDPDSAWRRGLASSQVRTLKTRFQKARYPMERENCANVVVLLDEIDKAEPDVPNDLLEPLELRQFAVKYLEDDIKAQGQVLIMITTNRERELPPAFMRRCILLHIDLPQGQEEAREWYVGVARSHFGAALDPLAREVAGLLLENQTRARARALGLREPSTAEYLDALDACQQLKVTPGSATWQDIAAVALLKTEDRPPADAAGGKP